MPKYVIERKISGAGSLNRQQLEAIAKQSNSVLLEMGPTIQWVHSLVAEDKIYCTYIAPDVDSVREHARRGGFPADQISLVSAIIDPTTGES